MLIINWHQGSALFAAMHVSIALCSLRAQPATGYKFSNPSRLMQSCRDVTSSSVLFSNRQHRLSSFAYRNHFALPRRFTMVANIIEPSGEVSVSRLNSTLHRGASSSNVTRYLSTMPGPNISEAEVRGLFHLWNDALATLDAKKVADRYSKNPVLLPTVSDTPRTQHETIRSYFNDFFVMKPQGVIVDSNVHIGTNWAQDAGVYLFTMGNTGKKVRARYTFTYVYEDGEWKIQHQHSSVMPESIPPSPEAITQSEVRNLFTLWNDALATLDADAVAKRYAKDAVLLPFDSNETCTDYAMIKDYFEAFLKKKPQANIESGNIKIGYNWVQDTGIYNVTMDADGSNARARYSIIYVFEDGQWKISHHHSSTIP